MELNREQIIKALECCTDFSCECDDCPLSDDNFCGKHLLKNALSLINELTEENERLHASYTELERKCSSLNAENERLNETCTKLAQMLHEADEENTDILVRNFELLSSVFLTKPKGE